MPSELPATTDNLRASADGGLNDPSFHGNLAVLRCALDVVNKMAARPGEVADYRDAHEFGTCFAARSVQLATKSVDDTQQHKSRGQIVDDDSAFRVRDLEKVRRTDLKRVDVYILSSPACCPNRLL